MKAKYFLCTIGLVALLSAGCAHQQQKQMGFIGIDQAKDLALTDSGFSTSEVEFTSTELKNRSGTDYYQVCFLSSGEKYRYDIDALTGIIIDCDIPKKTDGDTASSANSNASMEDTADTQQNTSNAMLTIEEAQAKALKHAGLSVQEVTFVKSQPDMDDGLQIYDIEFYTKDQSEYNYDIDAYTGEVLSFDYDAKSKYHKSSDSSHHEMLSEQQAMKLALAKVPGAGVHDIYEFETDYDDGQTIYEGKILYDSTEYEFEIDAYSGEFCNWEKGSIKD